MRGHPAVHPNNPAPIDGAVFDGPYEGQTKRVSAAEWLAARARGGRAGAV